MNYSEFKHAQQKFKSKDGNIAYIDVGEGDVILLLHGVPTSGWLYRNMVDRLSENHRVIIPDMLGFGNSDSPKGYEIYSEKRHAQRLLGLMNELEIEGWTHVMHDAGGIWTWELVQLAPQKIVMLVVLNTIIYEEGFQPPIRFKKGVLAKLAMWSYRNGITTNTMLKGLFNSGLVENNLNQEELKGYKTPLLEGKTRAMYYFFTQTCNKLPDYSDAIKALQVPTKIIWGKHDSFLLLSPQKQRIVKDLAITEEAIHILEAKHFIQEEKTEEIVRIILDFLDCAVDDPR